MNKLQSFLAVALFVFATILAAFGAPAESAPAPLIPRDILFGNPERAKPLVSPDGSQLAYLAPSAAGVMNVWVGPWDGGAAVQVTREPRRGIETFYWTPDGKGILSLRDSAGDENFHVFLTDISSKLTRDLTPFEGVRAVNLIPRASDILVGLNLRNRALFEMYAVDPITGAVRLDTENPGDVIFLVGNEWLADASGEIRAVRALDFKDGSTVLKTREGKDDPWREIARWPGGGVFDGDLVGFAADGRSLFVLSGTRSDTARVVRLDARTGAELEAVAADPRCDVWALDVLLHPDTRRVQAWAAQFLKREWNVLDPKIAKDFDRLGKFRNGFFRIVSRDKADGKWIAAYETPSGPVSFAAYDRISGTARHLFDDRPGLARQTLAEVQPKLITARDGLKLPSYLALPPGMKAEKLPLVLYVHGGPTARDEWIYDPVVQLLANRGYAVLQVNYRGSVGFGNAFQRAGDGQIGVGAMQNDLTDAVRWAVREGIADPAKIGIAGISYGGYAALAGLTFTPDLYACGVSVCGPANIKSILESVPAYLGPLKSLLGRIFGDAEHDEAYNRRISPLFHVDRIRVPLFVAQGANDPRCPMAESDSIVRAMRERGLPVTYVVYTDEGHGFKRPENRMDYYGRLEEFLAGPLGGRFEPRRDVKGSTAELK